MDKISIIVPCYNVEKYIVECMNSIFNQTYRNIEVFFIDDGSTDSTANLIREYIKDKSNFHYFYKNNGGISDARNYGLKKVDSEFFCFIDSDDYCENNFVEKLYESIINNNSDISVCGYYLAFPDRKIKCIFDTIEDVIKNPCPWNKLYKTKLFTKNKLFYPKGLWYEDLEVTSKLVFTNCKFSYVEKPLYNYRQNPNSITHTYDGRIFDIYKIVEESEKYYYSNKFSNDDLVEFMNIYHILINTTYRIYNHPDYSIDMLKDVCNYVKKKYPNWYKNKYIKKESFSYRIYLLLIRLNFFRSIDLILKIYN